MTVATYKWTLDRYHHAVNSGVFDDQRVELLKGEIVLMSPEGVPHASSSSDTGDYLRELLGGRAKVREGHPITLPDDSEPEPDIAIVEPNSETYRQHHPYPEDIFWVIEFSHSSLQKDLEIKSKIYAEAALSEYWVINLKTRQLIVFRDPINGEYRSCTTLTEGEIRPLAFPDVAIAVQQLLR